MGLRNDTTLGQPLATVGAQVSGEAVKAATKTRHFDNEGCEAVTN
jgi:hypothetical protein